MSVLRNGGVQATPRWPTGEMMRPRRLDAGPEPPYVACFRRP